MQERPALLCVVGFVITIKVISQTDGHVLSIHFSTFSAFSLFPFCLIVPLFPLCPYLLWPELCCSPRFGARKGIGAMIVARTALLEKFVQYKTRHHIIIENLRCLLFSLCRAECLPCSLSAGRRRCLFGASERAGKQKARPSRKKKAASPHFQKRHPVGSDKVAGNDDGSLIISFFELLLSIPVASLPCAAAQGVETDRDIVMIQ